MAHCGRAARKSGFGVGTVTNRPRALSAMIDQKGVETFYVAQLLVQWKLQLTLIERKLQLMK